MQTKYTRPRKQEVISRIMNERFFDLKKDRQDRIINGAMRIFAENGYRHASTDEMVSAAGISKGLLFHYFKSKKGTFRFLYEYGTRYSMVELREAERHAGCDFFEMYRLLTKADSAIMRKYPCLLLFLKRADRELTKIDADIQEDLLCRAAKKRQDLLRGASRSPFISAEDTEQIMQLLEYTREGLIRELLETAPGRASGKAKDSHGSDGPSEEAGPEAGLPLHMAYSVRFSGALRTLHRLNL